MANNINENISIINEEILLLLTIIININDIINIININILMA